MASSSAKPPLPIPPAASTAPATEAFRTKSVATRLSEAEFAEVESAAASAGQKVAEWLREAALSQARGRVNQGTDPILLTEIAGIRALVLNLFARASEEPLSQDDLRKISEYAEAVKGQKAEEILSQWQRKKPRTSRNSP
jgi:hypothetical protein